MTDILKSALTGSQSDVSRRTFLASAASGLAGFAASNGIQASPSLSTFVVPHPASHVIFINVVGGPSQIDTWDPKPDAPSSIRNFDPACATSVPGVFISENFPRLARRMHHVSLVRTLHHSGPSTHSAGQQSLLTGRCHFHDVRTPYFGSMVSAMLAGSGESSPNIVLGGSLSAELVGDHLIQSSVRTSSSDFAERRSEPVFLETMAAEFRDAWKHQERYGYNDLARMCLQARRLIERGTRVVTINQFPTVFDRTTWDMHANGSRLNTTAADYREVLCPQLDQALSGLLDDLAESGLLSETLVAVCGEMGRSPQINRYGGRDHHTGAWSGLLAGGPIRAGQSIGETDANGDYPISRPVTTAEFCATLYAAPGIDAARVFMLEAEPISELL